MTAGDITHDPRVPVGWEIQILRLGRFSHRWSVLDRRSLTWETARGLAWTRNAALRAALRALRRRARLDDSPEVIRAMEDHR